VLGIRQQNLAGNPLTDGALVEGYKDAELPYYNYQVSSNPSGEALLDQFKHQPTPPGVFIKMSMVDVLLVKISVVKRFLGLKTTLKEVRSFLEWNEEYKRPLQLPARYLIKVLN
jgi:hypothetical protein